LQALSYLHHAAGLLLGGKFLTPPSETRISLPKICHFSELVEDTMNEQDCTEIAWIKFWGEGEWVFVMALPWFPVELSTY